MIPGRRGGAGFLQAARSAWDAFFAPLPECAIPPRPDERLIAAALILTGFVLRLFYIDTFRAQPFPPDVPWSVMLAMRGAFDTVPKEPLFVWWLKALHTGGAEGFLTVRTWTVLWYVPTALALWWGARRPLGRWALVALALHASLPAQIAADANGERHVLETFFTVVLWGVLRAGPSAPAGRGALAGSAAVMAMALTRLNLGAAGLLAWATRLRGRRDFHGFAGAAILATLAVLPHFAANRKKTGDPFYSVNLHAYWFANKEFIGRPGFAATPEEWQRDAYRPSLTYRQWAFEAHTPAAYVKETLAGYPRIFRSEIRGLLLGLKIPRAIRGGLTMLLIVGLLGGLAMSGFRSTVVLGLALLFPFAFVSHVHMAPRFFAPVYPLIAVLIALGARLLVDAGRRWTAPGPGINPVRKSHRRGGR